jgi:hypothetical protein
MALNFNLLNAETPGQIASSFTRGYEGAQDRTSVLKQRETQAEMASMEMQEYKRKKDTLSKIQAAIVSKGGPPDLRAAATEMMRNPEYLIQGRQLLRELEDTERLDQYFAQQKGAGMAAPAAQAPAMPGTLGSGTFDPMAPAAAPKGLDLPQAGSDVSRTTNALDPSVIERMGGLSQPAAQRTTNALDPSIIERMGLSQPSAQQPVNALAPAPAPASNALAPAAPAQMDEIAKLEADIAMLSGNTDPRAVAIVKGLEKRLEKLQPKVVGNNIYDPVTGKFIQGPRERQSQLLTPEEEAQKLRIGAASRQPRAERAPRTQVTTLADGSIALVNLDTGQIVPAAMAGQPVRGKLSAAEQKQQIQQKQLSKDISQTILELDNISKEGGLIDQSTGSGAGRLVDLGARFVGQAMPGDIARGKLAPIADMVLKMVPRFEGPQSDKDTQSYKEAAGQLADSSLPQAIRKAAAKEITRIMRQRQGQFVTGDMANQGAPSADSPAPPPGFTPD